MIQKPRKQKPRRGIGYLLSRTWWAGVAGVAAVIAVVISIWPTNQHPTPSAPVAAVRFSSLGKITLYQDGVVLYYPSDWDLQDVQNLTINGSAGIQYVNPDDRAVSITEYGRVNYGKGGLLVHFASDATINDVKKRWMNSIVSLHARIIDEAISGITVEDGNDSYPVDGWRVIYQYVNHHGRSVTDMVKTTIANGRAVDLVMEAPTSEFPRYREAFLELGDKLLLFTKCGICSAQ
jgi:hypothetical protein